MTRVCMVGDDDVDLRLDIMGYETARKALAPYDFEAPFENSVAVQTISLGAAVALLNDLNWYLVRLVDLALVQEPSISPDEWLSRDLARQVRDGDVRPEETDEYRAIYGLENGRLVEPMYATPIGGQLPAYDLRDVEETVTVRVTGDEFSG
jgi:hypothetical protein